MYKIKFLKPPHSTSTVSVKHIRSKALDRPRVTLRSKEGQTQIGVVCEETSSLVDPVPLT